MIENKNVLGVPFYEFQCEESLVEEVLQDVKTNCKFRYNASNDILEKDWYFHEKMFDWFESCLEQVRDKYYSKDLEFVITTCWANKANRLQKHLRHSHPNSVVGGVFYLTTHESSKTIFQMANPWYENRHTVTGIQWNSRDKVEHAYLKGESSPVRGKLLLFPSVLTHEVGPLLDKDNQTRYTVSFNAFLQGVSYKGDNTSQLVLKVKGIRDMVKDGDSFTYNL